MHPSTLQTLQEIGSQLDKHIFPQVFNGGIFMPSDSAVPFSMGKEKDHAAQRQRRSTTTARERAQRRQGTPHSTSSLICSSLRAQYESEINQILVAYPETQVWCQPDGLMLLAKSKLLAGLPQPATFFVVIPYALGSVARAWGFWVSAISVEWIGPRHTNFFPNGSICAFESTDGTWKKGYSLVSLLDLYSLWAVRQLYLKTFGRWPGRQAINIPYEQILELKLDEYCGCDNSHKLYRDCCYQRDKKKNHISDAVNFAIDTKWGKRRYPPQCVTEFMFTQTQPPDIGEFSYPRWSLCFGVRNGINSDEQQSGDPRSFIERCRVHPDAKFHCRGGH